MAYRLEAVTVLPENLGSVPITRAGQLTAICNSCVLVAHRHAHN